MKEIAAMAEKQAEERSFHDRWEELAEKAADDPTLRKRLLAEPLAVLKENGIEPDAGVNVKIVEDSDNLVHLVIPILADENTELSEAELAEVAGGRGGHAGGGRGGHGHGPGGRGHGPGGRGRGHGHGRGHARGRHHGHRHGPGRRGGVVVTGPGGIVVTPPPEVVVEVDDDDD
jgi:hypothetical protein